MLNDARDRSLQDVNDADGSDLEGVRFIACPAHSTRGPVLLT